MKRLLFASFVFTCLIILDIFVVLFLIALVPIAFIIDVILSIFLDVIPAIFKELCKLGKKNFVMYADLHRHALSLFKKVK